MDIKQAFNGSSAYIFFIIFKIILAVLIFAVGWVLAGSLSRTIKKAMVKSNIDNSIVSFSNSVLKVVLRGIVILIVISWCGINISSIIAALGAGLVTVGLALKNNLSNAASGAIIIINKPFKIGDYLETNNVSGTVQKIEMLFTTLSTSDNKEVVVPNSKLTSDYIINYTSNDKRRLDILIPIKSSTKLSDIKPILNHVVNKNENLLYEPSTDVLVHSFEDGIVNISLQVWCTNKNYNLLKKTLQENIKTEFDKNNITF